MMGYARKLGLGEKTGINEPNEYSGRLPFEKSGWALNRMSSHGDDFEVTAVQLGTLVSAMGNGGKLLVPYVAHNAQEESKMKGKVRRQIDVEPATWRRMVPGMVGAVNYGSGKKAYDPLQTVAGKTGTCIGQGGWLGLFTSYAPLANPRLAVVVIARGPDAHSHFPAAVAGKIYRELGGRFGTPVNLQLATAPGPGTNDAKASELNEEDKDAAEAEAAEAKAAEAEVEKAADVASADGVTAPATSTNAPATSTTAVAPKSPSTEVPAPRNTVKRVLMTIDRPSPENQKPALTKPAIQLQTSAPGKGSPSSERPRRVKPSQR